MTKKLTLSQIQEAVQAFEPITLDEMKSVRLMNRVDTKYVAVVRRLPYLLQLLSADYRIQELEGGVRLAPYSTLYYDTSKYDFYLMHHNGRLPRQKVRIRRYDASGIQFLEVKNKNNKGRTSKVRTACTIDIGLGDDATLSATERDFLASNGCRYSPLMLQPCLNNSFKRITLVNRAMTERLTIDVDLQFSNRVTGRTADFSDFVIVELKRDGQQPSEATGILLERRIKQCGFSKYCMGSWLTHGSLKHNLFKEKLRYLQLLANETVIF